MDGMTAKAFDLIQDFVQGFPVDEFLLPLWTAVIEAMTTGRGAIVVGDHTTRIQPFDRKISLSSKQPLFSVGK